MKKIRIILFLNFLAINVFAQNVNVYYLTSNGKANYVIHFIEKNIFYSYSAATSSSINGNLISTDDPNARIKVTVQIKGYALMHTIGAFGKFPSKTYNYKKISSVKKFEIFTPNNISGNDRSEKETIYVCEMPKTYFLFSDSSYPDGKLLKIIGGNPKTGMIKISQDNGMEEYNYEVIETPMELKRKFFNGKTQILLLKK